MAGREVSIANSMIGKNPKHLIPIYDCGTCDEDVYIVMPKASRSLNKVVEAGPQSVESAICIATSIALGIQELGDVVSRDLKPSNILEHDEVWKIADFGLGRLEGAETTINSMRGAMTYEDAAPELWWHQRPTKAVDIYALGCIIYELIEGKIPFEGPDFRNQHILNAPPRLNANFWMQQIFHLCLSKHPAGRPSVDRLLQLLEQASGVKHSAATVELAKVGAEIATKKASAQAAQSKIEHTKREVELLSQHADGLFKSITDEMNRGILLNAPVCEQHESELILGEGKLIWRSPFKAIDPMTFAATSWKIVYGGYLAVLQKGPQYCGRSANLWYGMRAGDQEFRWWEMCYMKHPLQVAGRDATNEPFGWKNRVNLKFASECLVQKDGEYCLAAPIVAIDLDDFNSFLERWLSRLSKAANNSLNMPALLPEK